MKKCSVEGCTSASHGYGLCQRHVARWRRHGDPTKGRTSPGVFVPCSVDDCNRPHYAHGFCLNHWRRNRKYGDPLKAAFERAPTGAIDAFLNAALAADATQCLTWPFAKDRYGYGQYNRKGRKFSVHRVMCEAVHGPPHSPRLDAAHSCGNGHLGCCNPHHLRWATRKENMADMLAHRER